MGLTDYDFEHTMVLAADQAEDFVPLGGQVLSQVGPVLAGDAGDQCSSGQDCLQVRWPVTPQPGALAGCGPGYRPRRGSISARGRCGDISDRTAL